mmetsp:Transcript_28090/g.61620  ORF Transcript_28090/g.61620 Transcript_28090/m.61620 type:complete len:335 (+) Transcript_28090:517-1521(+)
MLSWHAHSPPFLSGLPPHCCAGKRLRVPAHMSLACGNTAPYRCLHVHTAEQAGSQGIRVPGCQGLRVSHPSLSRVCTSLSKVPQGVVMPVGSWRLSCSATRTPQLQQLYINSATASVALCRCFAAVLLLLLRLGRTLLRPRLPARPLLALGPCRLCISWPPRTININGGCCCCCLIPCSPRLLLLHLPTIDGSPLALRLLLLLARAHLLLLLLLLLLLEGRFTPHSLQGLSGRTSSSASSCLCCLALTCLRYSLFCLALTHRRYSLCCLTLTRRRYSLRCLLLGNRLRGCSRLLVSRGSCFHLLRLLLLLLLLLCLLLLLWCLLLLLWCLLLAG